MSIIAKTETIQSSKVSK